MREFGLIATWILFLISDLAILGTFVFIFVNLFLAIMAWWIPVLMCVGSLILTMIALVTMVYFADVI